MAELLKADWIEEIKQSQDAEARLIEEHSRYCALADALVKSEGLARFEKILKEIQLQAQACANIGAKVRICDVSRPADKEAKNYTFSIDVTSSVGYALSLHLDFAYAEGSSKIRCSPHDGDYFEIEFRPDRQGKLVMLGPEGQLPSETKAASFILAPLVKRATGR